jgi:hypothetical protein
VENRRELLEDELPSGVFQRLAPGTPVSTKAFSEDLGELVEHYLLSPDRVSD